MLMQLLWLVFIYFVTGFIVNSLPRSSSRQRNQRSGYVKPLFVSFLTGLGAVMSADWLSDGNPIWPALGVISNVAGALYPIGGRMGQSFKSGLAVYFGGVFYLKPVVALITFGIALEGLLWSKDRVLTAILFCTILPILFSFAQVNPLFLWASVIIQLLFLIKFKDEIRSKISPFLKSRATGDDNDEI